MCERFLPSVLFVILASAGLADNVRAQHGQGCGDPFSNAFGPYDYRSAPPGTRHIVEQYHFTPNIEALQSGNTGKLGGELDYTLRAFPNHPRALMAMVRLGQRDRTNQPVGAEYTVECYLERAIQFRPDDTNVREVRGIYYSMKHDYAKAVGEFKAIVEKDPNNANGHYNLGLAYFGANQYDKALVEAKNAQKLGFPLPGLRNKLKNAGKWQD